jgi:tRNA threonylcarbamoyl adenosine modification protein YeaZ
VIFVIDTSATRWAVAVVDAAGNGRVLMESSDRPSLAALYRESEKLTKVAVATGPGSFTGLRVGVSFGLGLAIGLRIPIIPLPSLDLQAARSDVPVIAVLEAGRGRVYYQLPGSKPMLGEAADIPASHPLVGNVAPKTEAALIAARHHFLPERELRDFSQAAARMLETAHEVAYGSLEIEYMQSFIAKP